MIAYLLFAWLGLGVATVTWANTIMEEPSAPAGVVVLLVGGGPWLFVLGAFAWHLCSAQSWRVNCG